MKHTLDQAVNAILGPLEGLRAVVLSAAPDGLIAWCWSRENKPEIALGFAALDRAATICLEGLGASQHSRNLLLTAQDAWVASWPLHDTAKVPNRERLVLTTVFDGKLQTGMVMVYGTRVRAHMCAALDAARSEACVRLRARLVDFVVKADDPGVGLRDLAEAAELDLERLDDLDQLSVDEQQRLLALLVPSPPTSSLHSVSIIPVRQL